MGRTVAIIQARVASRRLPGKVLLDIAGQSMLERVVTRVGNAVLDETVVATSTNPADDAVVAECARIGVAVVRGSEGDVLDRFRVAAAAHDAAICVRVSADSPLIDPDVCDRTVSALRDSDPPADYAGNKINPTYPLGLDVEAFTRDALERTWTNAREAYERSHVTVHMYENPTAFRLVSVRDVVDRHQWRWTVDTEDDLEFARQVFARFSGSNEFGFEDVVELIEREPHLARINAHVRPRDLIEG